MSTSAREPYHTALAAPIDAPPIDRYVWPDGSIAFRHDVIAGLSSEFDPCDILYADPPWPAGFAKFRERARSYAAQLHEATTFAQLMRAVGAIVERDTRPAFIVTGSTGLSLLPVPDQVIPSTLNGSPAKIAVYRLLMAGPSAEFVSARALLIFLAQRFGCVGDFMCGYGRSARIFRYFGKRFVCSDFNPSCIGYLRETIA